MVSARPPLTRYRCGPCLAGPGPSWSVPFRSVSVSVPVLIRSGSGLGSVPVTGVGSVPVPVSVPVLVRSGLVWIGSFPFLSVYTGPCMSFPFRPWSLPDPFGDWVPFCIYRALYILSGSVSVPSPPGKDSPRQAPTPTRKGPRGPGRSGSGQGQGRGVTGAAPPVRKVTELFGSFPLPPPIRYLTDFPATFLLLSCSFPFRRISGRATGWKWDALGTEMEGGGDGA